VAFVLQIVAGKIRDILHEGFVRSHIVTILEQPAALAR
jgi:hypothetical protein